MVLTLLEYVQDILSDLESDKVNTIGETDESLQVAIIVRDTYLEMVAEREWNWAKTLTTLGALADVDRPTFMRMPTDATKVEWIKYGGKDVFYKEPKAFRDMIDARDLTATNITADGYFNDRQATFWTTYDDDFLVFDAYDSSVESTMQASRSQAYVVQDGTWSMTDNYEPLLPVRMVSTLLAGAKSAAFLVLKQTANLREERKFKRGMERAHTEADKAKVLEEAKKSNAQVNFGRRVRGSTHRGRNNW